MSKDYYGTLGVSKNASAEEIKAAFRKKAHEHHPDKGGDAEKFKEINEAYQVLGNSEKRQQYDQFGSAFNSGQAGWGGQSGFGAGGFRMDFEDLGDIFGGFGDIFGGGQASAKRQKRGNDLEMDLRISFLEAAFGAEKELSFARQAVCGRCQGNGAEPGTKISDCPVCQGRGTVSRLQRTIFGSVQTQTTCHHCQGEGKTYGQKCSQCSGSGLHRANIKFKVKVPAGIDNGESIRLSGQGEAGQKGGPAGDLYLRVRVTPHPRFVRDGYDVRTEETISVRQAILGDKLEVETINGPVTLKIPEGTQSGTTFRLKGKGLTKLHGRGQGDQLVKVSVKIPSGLSRKQRTLLEELGI